MSMNTPIGSITQTTAIKDFIELENIDTQQYLLGINDIATGDGSKIKLEKILEDSISTDTGNTLEIGSDNKLLNIEKDTGVQAGNYTYPQNLVVNSKGRITSVTSGSPASVPIATTLQAGIVKPDGNTITVEDDGTINANILGYEVGDIVIRNTPTNDAGKHLLDGALIQYGSYQAFVDYIADLYNNTPTEDVYNVNIVGSLTNNNGVLSGFSASNYATLPYTFNPSNSNWEVVVPITTASSFTNSGIFASTNNSTFVGIHLQLLTDGKLHLYLSSDGTSHNLASNVAGASTLSANTKYWIKVAFNGVSYNVYSSTTGDFNGEEVTEITVNSSATLCPMTITELGENPDTRYSNPFNGSIDLNGCYINIDGQRWWSGVTEKRAGFLTEEEWQTTVTTYGSCGKFVYDSVNNTVRLPKVSDILQGTTDLTAIGDLIEAGLPNITGESQLMVTGDAAIGATGAGAIRTGHHATNIGVQEVSKSGRQLGGPWNFDASRSNSIYGNSDTVQPQTIKVLYYIVIANSTKTAIQVDIDEIATDLNGKADVDLTNVNDSGTSKGAGWAMPSSTYVNLTLGASGTTYTAPANGYYQIAKNSTASGQYVLIGHQVDDGSTGINGVRLWSSANGQSLATMLPCKKGDKIVVVYTAGGNTDWFRFIYAVGSESEA